MMSATFNIEQMIANMSVAEKVGQMMLLAFSGDRIDEARVLLEDHFVGATYISNDNIPNAAAAYDLCQKLQNFGQNTPHKLPILCGVDQEGAWSVMTTDSVMGPGNLALGATNEPRIAHDMYRTIGEELTAVGLNTLLAPCADCNTNPDNVIIGMRAFGEAPELVGSMTAAAVEGALASGVIPTLKHFPGHGDTQTDSHRGLPIVERDRAALFAIDLKPFADGIRAGAPIVMTAHIIFPALDPDNPATLSSIILNDVLRGDLGFNGVILSDSMNMHSMKKNFHPHDAAIRAFNAGVDLLMLAEEHYDHDADRYLAQQQDLINAVIDAVNSGVIPMSRVDDAVRRVLKLKTQIKPARKTRGEATEIVGSETHQQVALNAARKGLAVLSGADQFKPLDQNRPIVVVNTTRRNSYDVLTRTRGIGPNQAKPAFDYLVDALEKRFAEMMVISAEQMLEEDIEFMSDMPIIAVTENYTLPGMDFERQSQAEIIGKLMRKAPEKLIVVGLCEPYELSRLPDVPVYISTFSFRPYAAQAAAELLSGEITAVGQSPVSY